MDKINMLNWQQIELQKKFGKMQEKKNNESIVIKIVKILLLIVFFSLFFLNKDSQGFSSAAALSEPWLSEGDKWVL
jgi:uncharacterized membrane protein (DUF485 family)